MLLQSLKGFSLAGHHFKAGDVLEVQDEELGQVLIDRGLAESISHGSPRVSIISLYASWSQPSPDELAKKPDTPNWTRDGGCADGNARGRQPPAAASSGRLLCRRTAFDG
jgi:hypothetical protein